MRITISGDWREKLEALRVATERSRVALQKAAASGGDPEMLRRLGDVDAKQNIKSFAKPEGAASGAPWDALTPKYAARKRAAIEGRRRLLKSGIHKSSPMLKGRPTSMNTLVWSGGLKRSLTVATGEGRIVRQVGNTIELGSRHRLMSYHQEGGGNLPARPPVRKSDVQMAGLKREVAREVVFVMARAAGTSTPLGRYLTMRGDSIPRWNG